MTGSVGSILRHPLKSIGREALGEVTLEPGKWMPFDRKWAIAHERSKLEGDWGRKVNFLRGVAAPNLMAVEAKLDTTTKDLTLTHPKEGDITVNLSQPGGEAALLEWLHHLWPIDLPAPTGLYKAAAAHLTDVPDPWIAINTNASLKALSHRVGMELSPHRFRGNLWLDGTGPWEEMDWVGKRLQIGEVVLVVKEQITRCKATMANPETGQRDADVLEALNDLGHQEFGVYAEVTQGGRISIGDQVQVL